MQFSNTYGQEKVDDFVTFYSSIGSIDTICAFSAESTHADNLEVFGFYIVRQSSDVHVYSRCCAKSWSGPVSVKSGRQNS